MHAKKRFHFDWYLRISIIIIAVLLSWEAIFFYYFPFPNGDGPWALSHSFSILNGDFFRSNFAHSYMGFYNLPYMYGLLNAPFYGVFTNTFFLTYSIIFWNIIWVLLTLAFAYLLLRKASNKGFQFLLFTVSFLLSSYTYSLRPEIFLLPFLMMLLFFLDKFRFQKKMLWIVCFMTAIIGLAHPVAGFYAVFFVVIYCIDNKLPFKNIIMFIAGVGVAILLLYGPVVLKDIDLWQLNFFHRGFENDTRHFDFTYPLKFYKYSIPFFILTVIYIFSSDKKFWLREILYLTGCILILSLFERSYYFPYLFHFVFWRMTEKKEYVLKSFMKITFFVAAIAGLLICFILPTYQIIENKQYAVGFKNELNFVRSAANENPTKKIWVPASLAMSIIDHDNARLYVPNMEQLTETKPVLDTNSVYFLQNKSDISIVSNYQVNSEDSVLIEQVYAPVKGLVRLGIHSERSDSLGLWKIFVAMKK